MYAHLVDDSTDDLGADKAIIRQLTEFGELTWRCIGFRIVARCIGSLLLEYRIAGREGSSSDELRRSLKREAASQWPCKDCCRCA